ncbi:hypothetical protein Tco_1306675 [Tanacetum coccineum]
MIEELDKSNEMINKHMEEYEAAVQQLSLEEKIDLITVLHNYQKNMAQVKKYQSQQQKLDSKSEKRKFYSLVLRSYAGWKVKDFKGMSFKQIEEEFIPVWKNAQDFVPMDFELEEGKFKRSRVQQEKRSSKRLKAVKSLRVGLTDEKLKEMMELVHVEEVYVKALQVKRPIIGWYVHSDEHMACWKIVRVGDFVEFYQTFEDLVKRFDREDLDKLWSLVQETYKTGHLIDDKEKQLYVELKRLYEPDPKDQL